jgi:hypothetical protein
MGTDAQKIMKNKINYQSKYGSNKKYIKTLKKYVYFCKACGEYITKTTGCSNPRCPEPLPENKD